MALKKTSLMTKLDADGRALICPTYSKVRESVLQHPAHHPHAPAPGADVDDNGTKRGRRPQHCERLGFRSLDVHGHEFDAWGRPKVLDEETREWPARHLQI